jgi:hypothetical protein
MPRNKDLLRYCAVLAAVVVALGLRVWAVDRLPFDNDEGYYLAVAQYYTRAMWKDDLSAIIQYEADYGQGPLAKLVYASVMLPLPDAPTIPQDIPPLQPLPTPHYIIARLSAALFGTLQVLALAIFNPLAGLLLAVYTWQIKFTSEIMLEALPSLSSTLTVLFYIKGRRGLAAGKWSRWLTLSAVGLGITAASKYPYAVAGVAIGLDWLWLTLPKPRPTKNILRWLAPVVGWGLLTIAVFMAVNPHLWVDPFSRLKTSLLFHGSYAQGANVKEAGLPAWTPLVWIIYPYQYPPGTFLVALNPYITILAAIGLPGIWRKQRIVGLWLGVALAFLLAWPTKWPQYILILTVPLTLAAAEGIQSRLWDPFLAWVKRLRRHLPSTPRSE